jgi:hypothetical protein
MTDPARHVVSEMRYEVRLASGPLGIRIHSADFSLQGTTDDIAVLVRMTLANGKIVDEKIVGVIGSEYKNDTREFMNLRRFMMNGGVIGIHGDIDG